MKRVVLTAVAIAVLAASGAQASPAQPTAPAASAPGTVTDGIKGTGTTYTCVKTLVFSEGDKEVGRLTWEGGEARFIGHADRAARRFFDDLVKKYMQPALDAQAKETK